MFVRPGRLDADGRWVLSDFGEFPDVRSVSPRGSRQHLAVLAVGGCTVYSYVDCSDADATVRVRSFVPRACLTEWMSRWSDT